ncbi:MAG: CidA/LrgA family protein [Bacteroidales bacterium]
MIRGIFLITLFLFLGEAANYFTNGILPGSIFGMFFLFLALLFKIIDPHWIKDTAEALTRNMALFFVPSAVGLMVSFETIKANWLAILLSIILSTVIVITIVAKLQEWFAKQASKKANK